MEEAPIISAQTKENEKGIIQKTFELISNKGNKCIIKFRNIHSTSLLITSVYDQGVVKKFFESELTLEKIQENKVFSTYENIDEILTELFSIEEGKIHVTEDEGNIIRIKFDLPFKKYNYIEFQVYEKKKTNIEKIDELYNIIIAQNQEIKDLKSNIDSMKERIEKIEHKFNEFEKNMKIENGKYRTNLDEIKHKMIKLEKEKSEININTKSNIFNSMEEIDFIIDRLKNDEKLKDKKISFNLLFRATRDGNNSSDFHKRCDGKVQQLIFVKTTKGNVFGGYTEVGFDNKGNGINDNNSFLFSFVTRKIYNVIKGKSAIYNAQDRGPNFYSGPNFIIYIPSKMFDGESHTCTKSESYFDGISKDYEINNGENKFYLQEIESYQILYN